MSSISMSDRFLRSWITPLAIAAVVFVQAFGTVRADDSSVAGLLDVIRQADDPAYPAEKIRDAWDQLIDHTVEVIPDILNSIDDARSLVTVNWLSTALDRIASKGRPSEAAQVAIKAIVEDAGRSGYARRLALRQMERLDPGFRAAFIAGRLSDVEFGAEAIAAHIATADRKLGEGDKASAIQICRKAFAESTDFEQAVEIAEKLQEMDVRVPLVDHLGLLVDWYLTGPFSGKGMTAFDVVYPPEQEVDLSRPVAFEGKSYQWQHVVLSDGNWRFDLKELIEDANDCVAFAYTEFLVAEEQEAQLCAGADDTLAVWHNGQPVYSFPHYGNHLRADRHRVSLRLTKGKNTLLLKVAEAKIVPGRVGGGPKKWEFAARLVNAERYGVAVAIVKREE